MKFSYYTLLAGASAVSAYNQCQTDRVTDALYDVFDANNLSFCVAKPAMAKVMDPIISSIKSYGLVSSDGKSAEYFLEDAVVAGSEWALSNDHFVHLLNAIDESSALWGEFYYGCWTWIAETLYDNDYDWAPEYGVSQYDFNAGLHLMFSSLVRSQTVYNIVEMGHAIFEIMSPMVDALAELSNEEHTKESIQQFLSMATVMDEESAIFEQWPELMVEAQYFYYNGRSWSSAMDNAEGLIESNFEAIIEFYDTLEEIMAPLAQWLHDVGKKSYENPNFQMELQQAAMAIMGTPGFAQLQQTMMSIQSDIYSYDYSNYGRYKRDVSDYLNGMEVSMLYEWDENFDTFASVVKELPNMLSAADSILDTHEFYKLMDIVLSQLQDSVRSTPFVNNGSRWESAGTYEQMVIVTDFQNWLIEYAGCVEACYDSEK